MIQKVTDSTVRQNLAESENKKEIGKEEASKDDDILPKVA